MNNNDKFMMAIKAEDWIAATILAIGFGEGKGSRSGAWAWADGAMSSAAKAGIVLDPGDFTWPDFEDMLRQLAEATA